MSHELIQYDWTGVQLPAGGLRASALEKLAPALNQARDEVLREVATDPADAGFMELPDRIMTAYRKDGARSDLGRILATAHHLREAVDLVILLGTENDSIGAKSLMAACAHPHHNQLSRAERGGIPRLYFAGDHLDNDAVQALLDLLAPRKSASVTVEPWGIVVIGGRGVALETEVALRIFVRSLEQRCVSADRLKDYIVPVTGRQGLLRDLVQQIGCPDVFEVPDGVGGIYSVLSAAGLMPAALLGLDVVQLLEGARAMNEHFRSAPSGQNCALQFAGVYHAMEKKYGINARVLSPWSKALDTVGRWYVQLAEERLVKCGRSTAPWAGDYSRESPSRDSLVTNVVVREWRCDPVLIEGSWDHHSSHLDADCTLPMLTTEAIAAADRRNRDGGRPAATIRLPRLDEYCLGQLLQMLMLATAVERQLISNDPRATRA